MFICNIISRLIYFGEKIQFLVFKYIFQDSSENFLSYEKMSNTKSDNSLKTYRVHKQTYICELQKFYTFSDENVKIYI